MRAGGRDRLNQKERGRRARPRRHRAERAEPTRTVPPSRSDEGTLVEAPCSILRARAPPPSFSARARPTTIPHNIMHIPIRVIRGPSPHAERLARVHPCRARLRFRLVHKSSRLAQRPTPKPRRPNRPSPAPARRRRQACRPSSAHRGGRERWVGTGGPALSRGHAWEAVRGEEGGDTLEWAGTASIECVEPGAPSVAKV